MLEFSADLVCYLASLAFLGVLAVGSFFAILILQSVAARRARSNLIFAAIDELPCERRIQSEKRANGIAWRQVVLITFIIIDAVMLHRARDSSRQWIVSR